MQFSTDTYLKNYLLKNLKLDCLIWANAFDLKIDLAKFSMI